ncbi:MAG: hypothetical protein ACXWCO_06490 [Caldimonas sp.]
MKPNRFALAPLALAAALTAAGGGALAAPPKGAAAKLPAAAAAASAAASVPTQDRAELERTQIIGNRELPKVLYIVPWKKPLPGDLTCRPPVSVLDEALAPLDRDVFRRQVQYDTQAQARTTPAPAPAAK